MPCSTSVITIEKSMRDRGKFGKAFHVTTWIVFLSTTAFAVVCYLFFGANTCSVIVLNLGDGPIAMTAKLAIGACLSLPLVRCSHAASFSYCLTARLASPGIIEPAAQHFGGACSGAAAAPLLWWC